MLIMQYKKFIIVILGGLLVCSFIFAGRQALSSPLVQSRYELAILSNPNDPYYSLAEEIAAFENSPVLRSLQEVKDCQPTFLLWVVSPDYLSDEIMIKFGQMMKEQPSAISTGIITASTMEGARDLWKRRTQAQHQNFFAVNAANPAALINKGRIIDFGQDQKVIAPLTKSSFRNILKKADYLTFTGHGGERYLRLGDEKITSKEIPLLEAPVIGTGSCQTFRPWGDASIALGFIDKGAAAYSGFVFSPIEGYLMGEFEGLPYRYTWPSFPLGHVVQVQNRGTLQGFANFAYHYLLGDPRTTLQTKMPYQLVYDGQERGWRILKFKDVPSGVIPIHIPDGGKYHFIDIPGNTASADGDPFYNSRLQMINMQQDKFLLLSHVGGDLTLRMRSVPPWYWFPVDILLDSFDHTLFASQQSGGDMLALLFALLPLVWLTCQMLKKRISWQKIRLALALGLAAMFLHGGYVLIRLEHVTITSKAVTVSPLSLIATLLLSTCGALIYLQAHSYFGKVTALLVVTAISWIPIIFVLGFIVVTNFMMIKYMGTAIYNYNLGLIPAGALGITFIFSGLTLWFMEKLNIHNNSKMLRLRR
jgi:hypothetical protein